MKYVLLSSENMGPLMIVLEGPDVKSALDSAGRLESRQHLEFVEETHGGWRVGDDEIFVDTNAGMAALGQAIVALAEANSNELQLHSDP